MERPYSSAQSTSVQQPQEEQMATAASSSAAALSEPQTPRLESRKRPLDDGDGFEGVHDTFTGDHCSVIDVRATSGDEADAETASHVSPRRRLVLSSGRGQLFRRRAERLRRVSEEECARMARSRSEGSLAEAAKGSQAEGDRIHEQDLKRRRTEQGSERVIGVPQAGFSAGRAVIAPPSLPLSQAPIPTFLPPSTSFVPSSPTNQFGSVYQHPMSTHSTSPPTLVPSPRMPKTANAALTTPISFGQVHGRRRATSLPPPPCKRHQISHPPPRPLASRASLRPASIPPHRQQGKDLSSAYRTPLLPPRSTQAPSDVFSDPRAIVASIERQGGSWPLSQGDLMAYHAASLLSKGGEKISLAPLSLIPPITKATLRELDLAEILRNPQLRHDSVFDPNLMFRPNYDGERGDRKRELASQYWSAITREIGTGCRCTTYHAGGLLPCLCLSTSANRSTPLSVRLPSRIPHLIQELRTIFLSLLPGNTAGCNGAAAASREQVMEVLDAGFLAQQIERRVLDIGALARNFLGPTIKLNCAPMRDSLVDEMVKACEGDDAETVRGLTMVFEILELMKLDIANHQIRSLRPYLIQTAKPFETRFFRDVASRRQASGNITFPRTVEWFSKSAESLKSGSLADIVGSGALDLIFDLDNPSASSTSVALLVPETFQLDAHRISAFHTDTTDLTVIYLLMSFFQQLCYPARPTESQLDDLRQELWSLLAVANSAAVAEREQACGAGKAGVVFGMSKLEDTTWQKGMRDVGLQIAARATEIKEGPSLPSPQIRALVDAYLTSHLSSVSPVFRLLQSRLKSTLGLMVNESVASSEQWWTDATYLSSISRGTTDGFSPQRLAIVPVAKLMAQNSKRGTKRGHQEAEMDVADKRVRLTDDDGINTTPLDLCLARNGLTPLATEVRLLGDRIARVASFHLSVHHGYYSTILSAITIHDSQNTH